ncbi:MAG: hypothetical protein E6J90_24305 [Deltaproteobacteria bacterium]|nr:MAG: hypothetical protein E6J90_24305 [Deltaproteobacteria bacterium]
MTHRSAAALPSSRALVCAMVVAAGPARADTPRDTPTAIEVDRDAAPGGRVGFGFDGGEPVDAWGASLSLGWLERPIQLPAGTFGGGSPATLPVRRREALSLGGALAVGDRVVVDAVLRGSHQVGDRLTAAGNPDRLARYVLHDLRLGARIQLAGDRDRSAALRGELTLPSGDDAHFAGDAAWTAAWSLIGRATLPHGIVVAATAGIRLHGAEVAVGDRLVGDELFGALGAAVPLPAIGPLSADRVTISAELLAALGDHVGDAAGPSPAEARIGALVRALPELTAGVHAGFGLDDQIGAPRFRALVELAWTPRVTRPAPSTPPSPTPSDDDEPDEPDER